MYAAVMSGPIVESSSRQKATIAGALYAVIIVATLFAQFFVRGGFLISGGATAADMLAGQPLDGRGIIATVITILCDAALALIFYDLFKAANSNLVLLAAFFRVAYAILAAVASLTLFVPMVVLKSAPFLAVFKAGHLQTFLLASIGLYARGFNIALVYFALHCLLIGYLIHKTAFMPRAFGVLMAIAGVCYLAFAFTAVLSPAFAARALRYLLTPGSIAEGSLSLWLLVMGANAERWKERAPGDAAAR